MFCLIWLTNAISKCLFINGPVIDWKRRPRMWGWVGKCIGVWSSSFFVTEVALCMYFVKKTDVDPHVYFHVIDPMCTASSLTHGIVEPSGQSVVNTVLTFSCLSGFHLSSSPTVTCVSIGEDENAADWSGTPPICGKINMQFWSRCGLFLAAWFLWDLVIQLGIKCATT